MFALGVRVDGVVRDMRIGLLDYSMLRYSGMYLDMESILNSYRINIQFSYRKGYGDGKYK